MCVCLCAKAELEQQSVELVQSYQDAVENAISQLTDKRLQQLVLMKNSERYLDRHVASLEVLSKQMDKCRREIYALEDKNADLIDATSKIHPQIDALVGLTKKLKKEVRCTPWELFILRLVWPIDEHLRANNNTFSSRPRCRRFSRATR